tara:strand:- start:390 stop:1385 length:996 start_codon:yes stop_codon:yes gene_type:complete
MVNPHFFFEGKLSREESASALFATCIQQSKVFAERFCRLIGMQTPPNDLLEVKIEEKDTDVVFSVDSANTVVIVEIKIASGAKSDGQLAMYYERFAAESTSKRFVCVYLAPTDSLGKSEVEQLDLRPGDCAQTVTWEQVAQAATDLPDIDREFVREGLKSVLDIIERKRSSYYDRVGDRAFLYDTINVAHQLVKEKEIAHRIMPWRGKRCVEVYTCKTAITASVSIFFDSRDDGSVVLPRRNDLPVLTLTARFQPSKKNGKQPSTAAWWNSIKENEVVMSGYSFTSVDGWMVFEEEYCGTQATTAARLAELFSVLLDGLSGQFVAPNVTGN